MAQEYSSSRTSVNAKQIPAVFKKVNWFAGETNLDIGGGKYDTATEYLKTVGIRNLIFDPYNRPIMENVKIGRMLRHAKADTCTISNVLNVIKEKNRRIAVLERARKWSRIVYITVYEGNKTGRGCVSQKGCWQENRLLRSYVDEVREVFTHVRAKCGMIIAHM